MGFTLAFDAPQGQPLSLNDMALLPPEDWPGLQVALTPSVQQRLCHFNSVGIWRASKDGRISQAATPWTWRRSAWYGAFIRCACHYRSLEPAEALALAGMVTTGWTFAELCEQLAVTYAEGAPLQAVTWLKQWVQDGLLQRRAP